MRLIKDGRPNQAKKIRCKCYNCNSLFEATIGEAERQYKGKITGNDYLIYYCPACGKRGRYWKEKYKFHYVSEFSIELEEV